MKQELSFFDKISQWVRNSVTLKGITIAILALILLIPSGMIMSIIGEREQLNNMASVEVSEKWAGPQQLNGPILTIPLKYRYEEDDNVRETIRYYHVLPETLNIDGEIVPEKLKRGIYDVIVYGSELHVQGVFQVKEKYNRSGLAEILWEEAFITLGISDTRGIQEDIEFQWKDRLVPVEPGSRISGIIESGITIFPEEKTTFSGDPIPFQFRLLLRGSENISFMPSGSHTHITLRSPWSSPSFTGSFLPDDRTVSEDGFTSSWEVLELNRNYPTYWTGPEYGPEIMASAFGVNLILPVDDYQKSMRSAKYAILIIALTFLIFFLAEIMDRRKIHPFQYILVGLALSLFYILLVSISEHLHFNLAYLISSLTVIIMTVTYSLSVFRSLKFTVILGLALAGIYGFLFIILQISDYALLLGSIGLTLILAATMYFTRNINWYRLSAASEV